MTISHEDKHATNQILDMLRNEIGLSVHSVGIGVVLRAVRARMAQSEIDDLRSYLSLLQADRVELTRLIDTVVIPETSFFRDNAPFRALADYVTNQWSANSASEPLRILSLPCSTGEEPYSIAMVMADCGLDSSQFHIDAIDISERLLSIGKLGVYTDYSFRGTPVVYRTRYFRQEGDAYHLDERIRHSVSFIRGNILDADFVRNRRPYHVIFCRNLLIYFDLQTKRRAISHLDGILLPSGLIFVGHAETAHVPMTDYSRLDFPMAFGFCKHPPVEERFAPVLATQQNTSTAAVTSESVALSTAKQSQHELQAMITAQSVDTSSEAKAEGSLLEPAYSTLVHVEGAPDIQPDPDVLFELAQLLLSAEDDLQAEEALRRVIYLSPTHAKALLQLAELAEKRFDIASAESYRRRAHRVMKRTGPASGS